MKFLVELNKILNEANYQLYHDSYSSAVQEALRETKDQGYVVDEDDFHYKVTTGPRKPQPGETNSFHIKLLKDGAETNAVLHMQIYRMQEDRYELNMYIS